ncbi:MAG: hemolysin family protein [Pyrinomonadaceae bacterium]
MDQAGSGLLFFLAAETTQIASDPNFWLSTALKLLAVFLLVAANGFFVATEFSLVTVRKARIEARASDGSKGAKSALRLLEDPTLFISTVQLGVTLASLALGWLGEPTVAALLEPIAEQITAENTTAAYIAHGAAIVIAFSLVTFLHIVLGELFPKMFALERAESFALIASRPLELMGKIFAPLLWVFNQAGAGLAKLVGLKASLEESSVYTEDEIRQLIDLSRLSGHVNKEEQRLINSVFEFSETTVKETMIPRTQMAAISADCNLEQITEAFAHNGYSRLPVYREDLDDVLGFVHGKDVMPYLLKPETFRLSDVIQPPLYIVDTARLEDVLRKMQREKTHFGFVVDEHGGVEGIITLEDLLEEIVGDISDEHDEEVNDQILKQPDGSFVLDGGLAVRDLNRRLDLHVPESEGYTTIAGFLMSEAGQILNAGETVRFNGHIFQIQKVDRRRILKVRMEKVEDKSEAATTAEA